MKTLLLIIVILLVYIVYQTYRTNTLPNFVLKAIEKIKYYKNLLVNKLKKTDKES